MLAHIDTGLFSAAANVPSEQPLSSRHLQAEPEAPELVSRDQLRLLEREDHEDVHDGASKVFNSNFIDRGISIKRLNKNKKFFSEKAKKSKAARKFRKQRTLVESIRRSVSVCLISFRSV